MSFLDILKTVGGFAGAPFTGGATLPIALSGIGGLLSGASQGQAQNRGTQLDALLRIAQDNQQAQLANNTQALNQSQDARAASHDAMKSSIIANYLAGQGGGPIVSQVSPFGSQAPAQAPGLQAAMGQAAQTYTGAIPGAAQRAVQLPAYTPISMLNPQQFPLEPGKLEQILGYTGMGLGAFGQLMNLRNQGGGG
jgi:hypothetical protein